MSHIGRWQVVSLLLLVGVPGFTWGQATSFILQVPGQPNLQSEAQWNAAGLTITDHQGSRFSYVRQKSLDSADGNYQGYYSAATNRYLRWPVSGSGAMYLGEMERGQVRWRRSQMQVYRPVGQHSVVPVAPAAVPPLAIASHIDMLSVPGQPAVAGYIDGDGSLQLYRNRDDGWEPLPIDLRDTLVPGAPLLLRQRPGNPVPHVYSVDNNGRLLEISGGHTLTRIGDPGLPQFSTAANLVGVSDPRDHRAYVVDAQGRVWSIGLQDHVHQLVETRPGQFLPGSPLATVPVAGDDLYLIDRTGQLVRYQSLASGKWNAAETVARGFSPGGYLAGLHTSIVGGTPITFLSATDAAGQLRMISHRAAGWTEEIVSGAVLPIGSPLAIADDGLLSISAIAADGRWRQWRHRGGRWQEMVIADGFLVGAPVVFSRYGSHAFAIDRRGRLNAARYAAGRWRCTLCMPGYAFAPQLVSRRVVPNPPLPPANLLFWNSHNEDIVLKVADRRSPGRPQELRVEAGKSTPFRADRDAGGVFEEVYLAPGPLGTLVEQVHQYPVPPQGYYDIAVYADRVTSVFFDRTTNRSSTPDSIQKSLVSLGVFPLPPGDVLHDGDQLDAYKEAKYQANPGAAAWFGKP